MHPPESTQPGVRRVARRALPNRAAPGPIPDASLPQPTRKPGRKRGPEPRIAIVGHRDRDAIATVAREWLAPSLAELFLTRHNCPPPPSRPFSGNIRASSSVLGIKPMEEKT